MKTRIARHGWVFNGVISSELWDWTVMRVRTMGPLVSSAMGLGCMGMSGFYGKPDEETAVETLQTALELGVTLFDTADRYGLGDNERLLGRVLREHSLGARALVATKFGIVPGREPGTRDLDGSPGYVARACDASLARLGRDTIDLYYLHRADPKVPIEETVGAMGELVRAGKVRAIGLSEVRAETLERAHRVFPVAAVESEYSLWCRDVEREVLPACDRLGIAFVAYAPLGLGFFSGRIRTAADFVPNDYRPTTPRFQGEHLAHNQQILRVIEELARAKGCTTSQLALAWLLHKSPRVIPIPGTTRRAHLSENLGALDVTLFNDDLAALDAACPVGIASGERLGSDAMRWVNG